MVTCIGAGTTVLTCTGALGYQDLISPTTGGGDGGGDRGMGGDPSRTTARGDRGMGVDPQCAGGPRRGLNCCRASEGGGRFNTSSASPWSHENAFCEGGISGAGGGGEFERGDRGTGLGDKAPGLGDRTLAGGLSDLSLVIGLSSPGRVTGLNAPDIRGDRAST